MSRALWFVAGAGAGVYGLVKAKKAAEILTPEGLADRLAGLSVGMHLLRQEVRAGMDEKEDTLRARLDHVLQGQQLEITSGPRSDRDRDHPHHQKEEVDD